MKLGVYGGSFNPIHLGHLRVAEEVRELLGLDEIVFVPAKRPPLKEISTLLDDQLRLKCVQGAIAKNRHFSVSTVEYEREGTSYTLTTIQDILRSGRLNKGERPFLLVGEAFLGIEKWWRFQELLAETSIVWMSRPSAQLSDDARKQFVERLGFCYNGESRKSFEVSADKHTEKSSPPPSCGPPKSAAQSHGLCNHVYVGEEVRLPRTIENYTHSSGSELFVVDVTPVHVSSTDIRARLLEGRSVRYLVPDVVYNLLMEEPT